MHVSIDTNKNKYFNRVKKKIFIFGLKSLQQKKKKIEGAKKINKVIIFNYTSCKTFVTYNVTDV